MVVTDAVQRFLDGHRIAVVGASDDSANFGRTIYQALRDNGYDVVAVNPNATVVAGDECRSSLQAATPVDGVIVMVNHRRAVDVVQSCITNGVRQVWLFKGLGGRGAVSDEAVSLCRRNGIDVIEGACPLMFLEPVKGLHRFHRRLRRLNGSLIDARAATKTDDHAEPAALRIPSRRAGRRKKVPARF